MADETQAPAQPTLLVDPQGNLVESTPEEAQYAGRLGFAPATPKQIADHEAEKAFQEKYGTAGQQAATFAEKGLSALTFGGSTIVERGLLGINPEDIRARAEANPVAGTLGTVAGIALPLILSGGASTPEAGAQLAGEGAATGLRAAAEATAPALISRLGRGVTKAVTEALPSAAEAGVLRQLATKALATGAGSAVEGAAYGLGQVVDEAALGDPNLTAQSALATIGLSAALGGGMGGLMSVAEGGIPEAISKARDIMEFGLSKADEGFQAILRRKTPGQMTEWMLANRERLAAMEVRDPGIASKLNAIGSPETAERIANNWDKIIRDPGLREKIGSDLADSLQGEYEAIRTASKEVNKSIRPVEIANLLDDTATPETTTAARQEYLRLHDQIIAVRDQLAENPALYPARFPAELDLIRKQMWKGYSSDMTASEAFNAIDDAKSLLSPISKFGKVPVPAEERAIGIVKGLRSDFKVGLENPDVWGEAGARQAAFNSATSEHINATKEFEKLFMRTKNTSSGGVIHEIDPGKVDTYLNQTNRIRGAVKDDALDAWRQTSSKYLDEIEKSYQTAKLTGFDRPSFANLVDKSEKLSNDARDVAAVTQLKNATSNRMVYGSYGAAPITQAGAEGAVAGARSGIGLPEMGTAAYLAHAAGIAHLPLVGGAYAAAKVIGKAVELVNDVPRAAITLARLERAAQSVSRTIDAGVNFMLSSKAIAGGMSIGRSEVAAGVARSFGADQDSASKQFVKRIAEVQRLAGDPEAMHRTLMDATSHIDAHAPNTSQAMSIVSARALSFLASKVPQAPNRGLWGQKWTPSQAEIAKFGRYYEAANNPLAILKQAAAGTLTPEAIEAVSTIYPQLMDQIRSSALSRAASHTTPPPYRARQALGMLLGQDVDGSMAPAAVAANQATHAGPSSKSADTQPGIPGTVKPTVGGLQKLNVSSRALTPMQKSSQRTG
jgi:hypothetical protein